MTDLRPCSGPQALSADAGPPYAWAPLDLTQVIRSGPAGLSRELRSWAQLSFAFYSCPSPGAKLSRERTSRLAGLAYVTPLPVKRRALS